MTRSVQCCRWRMRWSVAVAAANIFTRSVLSSQLLTLGTVNLVNVIARTRLPRDSAWRLQARFGTAPHAPVSASLQKIVTQDWSTIMTLVSVSLLLQLRLWRLVLWSEGTETT